MWYYYLIVGAIATSVGATLGLFVSAFMRVSSEEEHDHVVKMNTHRELPMKSEYRRVEIEFAYYSKNLDRTVYTVTLFDHNDEVVTSGHVCDKDVDSVVNTLLRQPME